MHDTKSLKEKESNFCQHHIICPLSWYGANFNMHISSFSEETTANFIRAVWIMFNVNGVLLSISKCNH